jgi:hypothetical protein
VKPRIVLFSLFLLALPLAGFSQSTLNFPRLYEVADLPLTGIAIVNPSASAAPATFTFYNASGSSIASTTVSVPARQSYVRLTVPQIFSSVSARGWLQVTSPTTGLQGFWLGGDFVDRMDGAEASPVGQEFIFPLATADTELSLVSLASSPNTLTLRLYGSDGTELTATPATVGLSTNGAFKANLSAIFTTANFTNARYLKVTGSGNFTGTTLTQNFIHSPSWSVLNGIDTGLTVTEANFPHVPSGAGWTSMIGITNLAAAAQTVTITYYRPSGGTPVSVTRPLAARGSLRESAADLFTGVTDGFTGSFENGWVKITGTAPLGGYIAYGFSGTGGVAVVPMQPIPYTAMIFSHVASGAGFGTGLALLNATTTDAAVEVYVMRMEGGLVGGAADAATAAFTIPAGTKYVGTLDQFVPASVFNDGFVYMRSVNNVPIYGFQLFYTSTPSPSFAAAGNVAAGAVHPSITFTPPAPPTPLPTPAITSFTPGTAVRSGVVVIAGTGFSATAASNTVYFTTATGAVAATPSVATATSLTVTVPATAITGPVYVMTGSRFSNSSVLVVNQTATTQITNNVTVGASQNTMADIYVSAPAGSTAINGFGIGITETTAVGASLGGSSVEATTGTTRRLWITGDGVSSTTAVTISGPGVTVASSGVTFGGYVIVHITVAPGAAAGPRNIMLTNTNLDTSVITGGLIIR